MLGRTWLLVSVLGLGAVGAGCGGGGGGGGGSPTVEQFATGVTEAGCDYASGCFGVDPYEFFFGVAACDQVLSPYAVDRAAPEIEAAIAAGTIVYDAGRATACLDAIRAASCSEARPDLAACDAAVSGTVAAGGACSIDYECAGDAYCRVESMCPGTCQALVASGSACTRAEECVNGTQCISGTCRAPGGDGTSCTEQAQCQTGLFCLGGFMGMTGTCRRLDDLRTANVGDACNLQSGPLCAGDASCVVTGFGVGGATFVCVAPSASGASCNAGLPDPCPLGEACDANPLMLVFEGDCRPLPQAGEPCAGLVQVCALGNVCEGGTCQRVSRIGGACTDGGDCYSGNCAAGVCAEAELCGAP